MAVERRGSRRSSTTRGSGIDVGPEPRHSRIFSAEEDPLRRTGDDADDSNQPTDDGFDLIDVVPTARQKREEPPTKGEWLEVAELRELLPRDLVDHGSSMDLFIGDNVRDGGAGDVAFNALAIEILS